MKSVPPIPVNADPSSAGKAPLNFDEDTVDNLASATVPVKLPAGRLVKFAPLAAGNVAGNRASATVPVKLAAGKFVKLAPDPLNVVPVTIPAI